MKLPLIIAGCLFAAFECQAATLYRCVDTAGKVTFTQQACPQGNAAGDAVTARNPTISGEPGVGNIDTEHRGEHYPPTYQQHQYQQQPLTPPRSKVTVVGGSQPQAECSTGLNDRDLRTAMVRGEIVPGMTRKQVATMYGPVNRNAPARGAGVTTYWNDKYVSQTSVRYDQYGCAVSSWQSGHGGR